MEDHAPTELRRGKHASGRFERKAGYEHFIPSFVNRGWTWSDARINTLLEDAVQALGELNAYVRVVPDKALFLPHHVMQEAVACCRIVGVRVEQSEAMRPEEDVPPEQRGAWRAVHRYAGALRRAADALEMLPLSTRFLRQAHRMLMQGAHEPCGIYRAHRMGVGGTGLEDTAFIPPPPDAVAGLMDDLEAFWHNEDICVPRLIRLAISHYQFETIHPFASGNGRVGRLLVPLYLISRGMLKAPVLALSSYLERHGAAYRTSLANVRATGDLGPWVRFFLVAVRDAARAGRDTFDAAFRLRDRAERQVTAELGRKAGRGRRLLTLLYRRPWVQANEVAAHLDVTHKTAMSLLRDFEALGLLRETTGNKRNRRYLFDEYFALFAGA